MSQNKTTDAQIYLHGLIQGASVSRLIHLAAKLGIADLLKEGPMHYVALAEMTQTNKQALYRLLRALASMEVFMEVDEGIFKQTPTSELLVENATSSLKSLALLTWEPWLRQAFDEMLYSIKTSKPAFDHVHGKSFFEFISENKAAADLFDQVMTNYTEQEVKAILSAYDFSRTKKVIDIAGGRGMLIKMILIAYPTIKGVLFDLAHVINMASHAMAAIKERCQLVEGSFFESIPTGGDLYLLKSIIHDWDDQHAIKILKNCRMAMPKTGKLLLIERIITHDTSYLNKILDITMLVLLSGRERTAAEYKELLTASGFRLNQIIPTTSRLSIIEAIPI